MTFEEFLLDLSPSGDDVRVSLQDSPSGEASPFNARLPAAEDVERLAVAFENVRAGHARRDFELATPSEESLERRLEEIGEGLGEAIFQRPVHTRWSACHGRGVRPETPIRLRLKMPIDGAGGGRLHATPWECLRLPGGDFVALDAALSLVRHVVGPGRDRAPVRPRRLIVLLVASQAPGLPPLDLDAEIGALRRLERAELHFELLAEPSLEALRSRLDGDPVHVLHFLGHGGLDPAAKRGAIFLARPDGGREAVSGAQLANALQPARALRLVFLNACRTAAAAAGAPFAGVATAVIRRTAVPAVVAMQYPIPDRAAILFAREVYGRLAAGEGLDAAVTEGRRRLYHQPTPAWVVPVLFSRLRGGDLFAVEPAAGASRWSRPLAVSALAFVVLLAALAGWFELGRGSSSTGMPSNQDAAPGGEQAESEAAGSDDGAALDGAADGAPETALAEPPVNETALHEPPVHEQPAEPAVDEGPAVGSGAPPVVADHAQTLDCGDTIHFANADAYVSCRAEDVQGERFLSLTLRYGGRTYGPRPVFGDHDVTFDDLPGVSLSVADVDFERGRLTAYPPTIAPR